MRTTSHSSARAAHALLLSACALLCGSCGPSEEPDDFKGFVDGSAFDTKFLAGRCGSTPCYPSQAAFVKGQPISFYNLGVVASTATVPPPVIKAANLPPVFDFPGQRCKQGPSYEPMRDPYDSTNQLPLFSALPLATKTAGVLVSPFVNVVQIVSNTVFNCNDAKDASEVAYNGSAATKYALTADTSTQVRMRAVIDPTAPLAPATADLKVTTSLGWYKSLLLTYLDGGPVPVNEKGELVAMDGVILDPAGATTFAKGTDQKVVILPFAPGDDGYSPIVRLHSWRLPAGKVPGDFTGLCTAPNCGPKDVNFALAATAVFNTIFIVTQ